LAPPWRGITNKYQRGEQRKEGEADEKRNKRKNGRNIKTCKFNKHSKKQTDKKKQTNRQTKKLKQTNKQTKNQRNKSANKRTR